MDLGFKCDQVKRMDLMGTIMMVIVIGRRSRWLPVIFATWYSCLCENSSSWVWAGPSDLLLMNKIWQRWWNVTSVMLLQRSLPLAPSLFLCLSVCLCLSSWLLTLMKSAAMLWAATYGAVHVARNGGGSLASGSQETEFCLQPRKWAQLRSSPAKS